MSSYFSKPILLFGLATLLFVGNWFSELSNYLSFEYEIASTRTIKLQDPQSKELVISSEGKNIYGLLYLAKGSSPHPTVIFLNGFPGFERNQDVAQEIRRKGWNTVSFNYRGSWGSDGYFSYENCINDIDAIINYLKNPDLEYSTRIDKDNFILIGGSFGGGIALNYLKKDSSDVVTKVIVMSSFNMGKFANYIEETEQVKKYEEFLSKKGQIKFEDVKKYVENVLKKKNLFNYENYCNSFKEHSILIIDDNDKHHGFVDCLKEANVNVTYQLLGKDHNFSSHRIELTKLVLNWLQAN